MLKHRSKKQQEAAATSEKKEISSAKEFKEHVGSTADRVSKASHSVKSTGAKEFIERVGKTSDRIHDSSTAESKEWEENRRRERRREIALGTVTGAVTVAFIMLMPREYHMAKWGDRAMFNEAVAKSIMQLETRKHQAIGESVSSGLPTTRGVAKINIDKIKGYSAVRENGHWYELGDSYSTQFNINLGIITKNKERNAERGEVLWLQDAFQSYRGKAMITSEIYHGTVQITREELDRKREMEGDAIDYGLSLGLFGSGTKEISSPVDILHGIKGKGSITGDSKRLGYDTYRYTKTISEPTDKVHLALDIRTAVKGPHEVEISFGYAPIEKGGKVDWKKEVTFDNVTYHVKDTVVGARMDFSKVYDAGLTVAGFSDRGFFYAQKLSGRLGLYEEEKGKLVALPISGFTDYSTGEYTYNVKSMVIHKGVVKIGTATGSSNRQKSE